MLEISIINDLIEELENGDTSLSTIRNLSALYNVKSHLLGSNKFDRTAKELNDILPSYIQYVAVKRKYQMKEITETKVLLQLGNVCQEIKEFIQTLYSGTDTQEERNIIKKMIKEIQ